MQSASTFRFADCFRSDLSGLTNAACPRTMGRGVVVGLAAGATLFLITSGAQAQQLMCDQDQSLQEVRRLTDAHTIVSVDVFMPNVTVVVDDRAWQRADLATKKSIAQNVDCATGGPNNRMLHFVYFRSVRSNEQVAEYSRNELTLPSTQGAGR
jgi:hypothetical protein